MKIEIKTSSYNAKRYGRPWIAKVQFDARKGEFTFGDWIGDPQNGSEGILIIDANEGNILARGQKDRRKPQNSAPDYYQVSSDGKLVHLNSPADAYLLYQKNKQKEVV